MASTLQIVREHRLGLARARKLAWKWAEQAERHLSLQCTVVEHEGFDDIQFVGMGVKGTLRATPERFQLKARLGFPTSIWRDAIRARIEREFESLFAKDEGGGESR